ncbi:penicillin-binding transpeptidase domain-containing protein [Chitinophaga pollutisoli]|uniref:Penicillin-binding transpeptidase domain-containing protein n=1 Tax=Chitinophaga pollutisoli TaxID=3133966 RepID=A0ABZ2YIE7_9BACT
MKRFGLLLIAVALGLGACTPNNVKDAKEWQQHFAKHKLEGSFMLFDNGQGTFRVYNIERAKERFVPAGVFEIFLSITGLQTGAISDTNMVTAAGPFHQAFRNGSAIAFQEVARAIGKDTLQHWLDTVGFGNKKISRIDTFWLDNSLQISADEVLGFTKQLYFNQLPYQRRAQELTAGLMVMEKTDKFIFAWKSGYGNMGSKRIGWVTGWIEENRHPSFFVLNFETENPSADMNALGMEVTRAILGSEGFYKGEK